MKYRIKRVDVDGAIRFDPQYKAFLLSWQEIPAEYGSRWPCRTIAEAKKVCDNHAFPDCRITNYKPKR